MRLSVWILLIALIPGSAKAETGETICALTTQSFLKIGFQKTDSIDLNQFQARRNFYLEELKSGRSIELPEGQDLLAFIEASGQMNGSDLFKIESALQHPQSDRAQFLRKFFEQQKNISSEAEFNRLGQNLYLMANSTSSTWKKIQNKILPGFEASLKNRLELQVAREDLGQAFQHCGVFKDANQMDRFRKWVELNPLASEAAYTASLNAIGMATLKMPLYLPGGRGLLSKEAYQKMLGLVRTHGWDSAYPLLKKQFGTRLISQYAWDSGRKVYAYYAIAQLGYYASEVMGPALGLYGMSKVTKKQEHELQEKNWDPKGIRTHAFEVWKEAKEFEVGHPLDPKDPSDLRLMIQEREWLNHQPDSIFRVN